MIDRAELVSTGSELLSGRTLNSHARSLGRSLSGLGMELVRDTTIRDEIETIRDEISAALERVPLVFVTGGLGPTADDLTRDAIAGLLGRRLVPDGDALERIRRFCEDRNRVFNRHRAAQADIVEGAVPLANRLGAAPGELIELDGGRFLFVLPGPPAEFEAIMEDHVIPWLRERAMPSGYRERIYLVCGLGEADMVDRFEAGSFPPEGVDTAFCAAPGRVELRLSSRGGDDALLDRCDQRVRALLGEHIFADRRVSMEEVVGGLLRERGWTVAVAESCTGGLLGARLTSVAGSSDYFLGGIISYSNRVKAEKLGVEAALLEEDGAVSASVVEAMASGVRERFRSDCGLAISGIAGPGGGSADKPVGLVYIGLADGEEVQTARFKFGHGRARVRRAATQMALDMLRRKLSA